MIDTMPPDDLLSSINIPREVYDLYCKPFLAIGFTPQHMLQLFFSQNRQIKCPYIKLLTSLQDNAFILLQAPYELNPDQIITVLTRGGVTAVAALIETFSELRDLGFSTENIVKIASLTGSKKLQAIVDFKVFPSLGLTVNNIFELVKWGGGAQSLDALRVGFQELCNLGLTLKDITRIACHKGSAHEIECILKYFKILRDKQYSIENIVSTLSKTGGFRKATCEATGVAVPESIGTKYRHLNFFHAQRKNNSLDHTHSVVQAIPLIEKTLVQSCTDDFKHTISSSNSLHLLADAALLVNSGLLNSSTSVLVENEPEWDTDSPESKRVRYS